MSHQIAVFTQLCPTLLIGDRSTEHHIRMTDNVFGRCLNGNIDAMFEG
ncbi:Uncharacterised protein [Vibrio cholerae]|nr:Uncharacterised protein [Vibrio cholerae]CSI47325.1 Uncharacterised protein [Vibrio cholerae]CSI74081.1 Uncharacterised protein [Vibrio cholerae]